MKIRLLALLLLASLGASAQTFSSFGNGALQRKIVGTDTAYRSPGTSAGTYLYSRSEWYNKNLSIGSKRVKTSVYAGDSMTDTSCVGSYCPTNYPTQLINYNLDVARSVQVNVATAGRRLYYFVDYNLYTSQVAVHKPANNKEKVLFFFWLGVNDFFDDYSAAGVYYNLKLVWAQAKADGFTVVAFTLGHTTNAPIDAKVNAVNTLIASDPTLYDYLVRPDLINPDPTNLTYFNADGLHLTAAGSQRIAKGVDRVLKSQINGYDANQIAFSVINGKTDLKSVSADEFVKKGGTSAQFLKGDGSVDNGSYQVELNSGANIKTIDGGSILGAGNIDLAGTYAPIANPTFTGTVNAPGIVGGTIIGNTFIKSGGTAAQFLKADGSIDNGNYQPLLNSGANIKTINGGSILGSGNIDLSNSATATALANTRTIWGQNFNGTANVSGALTGVTDITASGAFNGQQGRFQGWYSSGSGEAVEAGFIGGFGLITSYDRTSSTYRDLYISAYDLKLQSSGSPASFGGNLAVSVNDGNPTSVVRNSDLPAYASSLRVVNTTGTPFSKSTLNSTYPSAAVGMKVVCTTINIVYEKYDSTNWFSTNVTILP